MLTRKHIPRCHLPKQNRIVSLQLHGFCDASEDAYGGVLYLRLVDDMDKIFVSLVTSKTKVSPIKRLTIPRLELCGALLLAELLHHVKELFHIAACDTFAWSDSTARWFWAGCRGVHAGSRPSLEIECPTYWICYPLGVGVMCMDWRIRQMQHPGVSTRLEPIMLQNLPIMLFGNAAKLCLLCSILCSKIFLMPQNFCTNAYHVAL